MEQRTNRVTVGAAQVGIVLAALAAYLGLRPLVEGDPTQARANTARVLDIERTLGLDVEARVQSVFLDSEWWVSFWNVVYQGLYWPSVAVGLVLLWRLDRERYITLRDALFVSAAIGLVIFATFPVSPPRFLPGYVDTLQLEGMRSNTRDATWTNAYAAVPSFHVGWPALAGGIVAGVWRRWWVTLLAYLPAALIAVAVVATGNHFVVDIIAGLAVVGAARLLVIWAPTFGHATTPPDSFGRSGSLHPSER